MRRSIIFASLLFTLILNNAIAGARVITFATAKSFNSGVTGPGCVASGDFNGDGYPDLAITDHGSTVTVLIGKGDGTFASPVTYTLDFYVLGCVAVGDFNGDHNLDLALVGGDTSGNSMAVLMGRGDGTFDVPIYFATALGGAGGSLALADLNNDHNLDLFLGGNGSSDDVLGDGKGGFKDGQLQNASGFSVTIGDFNHDGNLDAAVTSPFGNSIAVLLGNGDGTFKAPETYSGVNEPTGIVTGDFNLDGKLDLAVAVYNDSSVLILLGNGDGTFTNAGEWLAGGSPGTVVTADFNKDGKPDLAASDFNGDGVTVLPGVGTGKFPTSLDFRTGLNPVYLAVADFNKDGSPDLAVANDGDNTVSILLNAAGTFETLRSSKNPSKFGQPVKFAVTVRGSVITSPTPTGRIDFKDGARTIGHAQLNGGKASFTTSNLHRGRHDITAVYSGDAAFNPNVSKILVQRIE